MTRKATKPPSVAGKVYRIIMGILKKTGKTATQAFRYKRTVWAEPQAKSHCKAHKGKLFEPATGEKKADLDEPTDNWVELDDGTRMACPEATDEDVAQARLDARDWTAEERDAAFGDQKNAEIAEGRGDGQGQGGGRQGDGGADKCVCPKCGTETKHKKGTPCTKQKCPKCGATMTGKGAKTAKGANDDSAQVVIEFAIAKKSLKKGLVYGIVYAPEQADAHDCFMTAEEVEKAAHRFMLQSRKMDDWHNFVKGAGAPVESFIARPGDPDFPEGAWVIGAKIFDDQLKKDIAKGEVKSFSLAGVARWGKEKEMDSRWWDDDGNPTNPFGDEEDE